MGHGKGDSLVMSHEEKQRVPIVLLLCYGLIGIMMALIVTTLIMIFGGQRITDSMVEMNERLLKLIGNPPSIVDGRQMLAFQISGVGFALGVIYQWYKSRNPTRS